MAVLRENLAKYVDMYNESSAAANQLADVLLFDYMLQHLARVSRILAKPAGNGLLIGLGGNGRKTVAKLATYINECTEQHIEFTKDYGEAQWRDDLRNLYKTIGVENKKTVFNLADRDIIDELFIEDINNILNVGELTSLFTAADYEDIEFDLEKQLVAAKVKDRSRENKMTIFQKRCQRNLHLLLYFSPAGNQL